MDQIREKQFVGQMKEKDVVDSIFLTNDKQVLKDKNGKEYACYAEDLKNIKKGEDLSEDERAKCTDISLVLGDSW